jgi:metal-responsive CopG/Arc/MetJ family transcriptional regulator
VKGRGGELNHVADQILNLRGDEHGKLATTTTGKDLK